MLQVRDAVGSCATWEVPGDFLVKRRKAHACQKRHVDALLLLRPPSICIRRPPRLLSRSCRMAGVGSIGRVYLYLEEQDCSMSTCAPLPPQAGTVCFAILHNHTQK
jgi:hypothetical protein